MSLLTAGAVLIALVTGLSGLVFGGQGALAAAAFGLLALGIQAAARWLAQGPTAPRAPFPAGWLWGVVLRFGGVILLGVAVMVNRHLFPPLPAALGYLGVLMPLLVLELRSTR